MAAGPLKTGLGHQQVDGETGQVIRHGLNAGVMFLVADFPVGLAVIAGFRPDG
jgi:hypothetical protein